MEYGIFDEISKSPGDRGGWLWPKAQRRKLALDLKQAFAREDVMLKGSINAGDPEKFEEREKRIDARIKDREFFRANSGWASYFWNKRNADISKTFGESTRLERLDGTKAEAGMAVTRISDNAEDAKERSWAVEDTKRVVEAYLREQETKKQEHEVCLQEQSTDGVLNAVIEKQREEYFKAVEHERIEKYNDWNRY